MNSSLKDWLKFEWLKEHRTSREEVADLLAVADRGLTAGKTPGLHNDWRFNIAYNSALQLASAALAMAGYQAERTNHHYRVIDSLSHTLGTDAATIKKFDTFRKKRNTSDYEQVDTISEAEADDMRRGIRKNHADLQPSILPSKRFSSGKAFRPLQPRTSVFCFPF